MSWVHPDRLGRVVITALAAAAIVAGLPGNAAADPPPPPNPGDSQLNAAATNANDKAAEVDALATRLAGAQSALDQLHKQLELTLEQANKAAVDLRTAQDAVAATGAAEAEADRAVTAAEADVMDADQQATRFAVGSFQQGSTIGNFSAYMTSHSPEDLLDRVALLNAVGGSKLDVIKSVAQAQARTVEAKSAAAASKDQAAAAATAATAAKQTADDATRTAQQAQQSEYSRALQLETQRNRALYDYDTARANASGLQEQRLSFERWDAQRRAAAAAAERAAQEQARQQIVSMGSFLSTVPASDRAQAVIKRAASQLGVPYAWGGGNSVGPTPGIRDGGVADSYGDFAKVGFDCSGLMMYAFGAVGVALPHYAGYQYLVGRQVPLADLQPGDMVFYSPGGIHHVALYIGGGQMIEAPQSGSFVTVSPLRLNDIMPNAARVV